MNCSVKSAVSDFGIRIEGEQEVALGVGECDVVAGSIASVDQAFLKENARKFCQYHRGAFVRGCVVNDDDFCARQEVGQK